MYQKFIINQERVLKFDVSISIAAFWIGTRIAPTEVAYGSWTKDVEPSYSMVARLLSEHPISIMSDG